MRNELMKIKMCCMNEYIYIYFFCRFTRLDVSLLE